MLESAVFWGAWCALAWGFSDYFARLAGRSVGAFVAIFAVMAIGAVLIAAIMAVRGEPIDWRPDGLHWLLTIGGGTTIGVNMHIFGLGAMLLMPMRSSAAHVSKVIPRP